MAKLKLVPKVPVLNQEGPTRSELRTELRKTAEQIYGLDAEHKVLMQVMAVPPALLPEQGYSKARTLAGQIEKKKLDLILDLVDKWFRR